MPEAEPDAAPGPWPRAAVFDCDGLLVDSERCWHAAYRAVAERGGGSLDGVDLDSLNGASVGLAAERLSRALGRPVDAGALREELERAVAREPVEPMPGARSLLEALRPALPLGLATNGPASVAETVLDRAGLLDHFSALVSAEELAAPKPEPIVYLEACRRLGVAPAEAVAFEDSRPGAAAARAAGMFVVAIPSGEDGALDANLRASQLDDPALAQLLGLRPVPPSGEARIARREVPGYARRA